MAVVYLHKRNDTNEVFYVGIGKTPRRAFTKSKRSVHWYNVVNKVGYTVDLLVSETPWEDACKIEKLLIEKYGRKDLGLGSLVNMTDGGDGSLGVIVSNDTRQKLSELSKGEKNPMFGKPSPNKGVPRSKETKKKIGEAHKGEKSHRFGKIPWNKGVSMSEETKEKMSEAAKNRKKNKQIK